MDCSEPLGFREHEFDVDHLSGCEILNKGFHCCVGLVVHRRTAG
jgi:hypothetical protein